MQTVPKITCDHCSADITTTTNCEGWRLSLSNQAKTPWYVAEGKRGGAVTSAISHPPIDREHHFCNTRCLAGWVNKSPAPREVLPGEVATDVTAIRVAWVIDEPTGARVLKAVSE